MFCLPMIGLEDTVRASGSRSIRDYQAALFHAAKFTGFHYPANRCPVPARMAFSERLLTWSITPGTER